MIVVAIIGVLAALAVPKFGLFQAKARQAEVKSNLSHIYTLQQSYFGDNDTYLAFTAVSKAACTNPGATTLGFTPSPCAKLRYSYASTGGATFTATGTGAMAAIYPGCSGGGDDVWQIDQLKALNNTRNGLSFCGGN